MDRVLASYKHLFNGLDSMIKIHGVLTIKEVGHVRKHEYISQEVQAFIDTHTHATLVDGLTVTKENITHYMVESVRMYTKLVILSN